MFLRLILLSSYNFILYYSQTETYISAKDFTPGLKHNWDAALNRP